MITESITYLTKQIKELKKEIFKNIIIMLIATTGLITLLSGDMTNGILWFILAEVLDIRYLITKNNF